MKPRAFIATVVLALALAPAAFAQEEIVDDPVPEATAPPPGCERGPGTDADYAYCPDLCDIDGADGDYAYQYCVPGVVGDPQPSRPPVRPVAARGAVQPLAAQTLPMTGSEAWLVGGLGAGFLLAGTGLRLRIRAR